MATIFSEIIKGNIPSYKVAENDKFYAFLDINPVARGHVLVVPKKEIDYLFDIESSLLGEMMIFTQTVAKAIKLAIPCNRVSVVVLGLEVPHAHIHLIPINNESDVDFRKAKLKLSPTEMNDIAQKIAQKIADE